MSRRPGIAVAIGDPAGIGPEIAVKAALDPGVRETADILLVGQRAVLERHAAAAGLSLDGLMIAESVDGTDPDRMPIGEVSAEAGRAMLSYARGACVLAMTGEADAVVAAPQTQKAAAAAGIPFDGYPRFVGEQFGTDPGGVFLMLANDRFRIAHVTLHVGLRKALEMIDRNLVGAAIAATDKALRRLGIERPRIAVSGLNPHAGEGGLFGAEDGEIIAPAIAAAHEAGLDVDGPFGADTMILRKDVDAFVVMLHDQGHVPAKLVGFDSTTAFTIGVPLLFASVAHGSAHDIAGKGIADPGAMIATIHRLAGAARGADRLAS